MTTFSEKQVRDGVISYGLSSYGYDIRVADEFKIFTNVYGAVIDPKAFRPRLSSTARPTSASCRRTPSRWRAPSSASRFRATCWRSAWEMHLRALRHHRQRHAARADMGRLSDAGNLEHHASARPGLCQRRPLPDPLPPAPTRSCEVSYADAQGKYQKQQGIVLPKL